MLFQSFPTIIWIKIRIRQLSRGLVKENWSHYESNSQKELNI